MKQMVLTLGVLAASAVAGAPAFAAGDAAAGEKIAKTKCVACHTFDQGGANKVGPNLFGAVTRGPGKAAGYTYSKGYLDAVAKGFIWDENNLMVYLEDPTKFLVATSGDGAARSKMTFKLPSADDRANVIAYLQGLK